MEKDLDEIAKGKEKWQEVLKEFYEPFEKNLEKKYEEVNLDKLSGIFSENEEVTIQTLKEKKIIKGKLPVKLLGRGEIRVPLTVKLSKVSSGALEKIKKAGGTVIEILNIENQKSPPAEAKRRAGKIEK